MVESLLQINFEKWSVFSLSIAPALVNLVIFLYISFFLYQNKTNRIFSFFVLLLAFAQASDGLMQMSITSETAYLYNRISLSSTIFAMPFGVLFVLRFTGWCKRIHYALLNMILFLPAIFIEFVIISRLDKITVVKSEQWNWIAHPESTIFTIIIFSWITSLALAILVILWLYYFIEKTNQIKKTQTLLLASGFTIPVVVGIGAEVILPFFIKQDGIPLTATAITTFSLATLYALKKHQLFDYSPKHQWDDIIENMNEGILIVDNSDKIMYANKTFCELVEYAFHEIHGKIATELFIEKQDHKELIEKVIRDRKKNISSQYEIQMVTKSGKKLWMLTNGSPYLDRKGNIIGSIGIKTNINYLKDSEEKLKTSNKELETYIYKASHDLRAPIASMLGLIQISKKEIKDETSIQYLGMIDTMTQKLDIMLSDLIKSMAIKDTGTLNDIINFSEIIEGTLSKFEHVKEYDHIKIYTTISNSTSFLSSKFIIETIFQNLIANSIKYQNFKQQESFLKIRVDNHGTKTMMTFEDNGIGIENSQIDKIFDMYYRANEQSKGSGLGLYLVKKGIEKLNGEIQVSSTLGKGTTFTILV